MNCREAAFAGGSAVISECGRYRYLLEREGDALTAGTDRAAFLMLNPSVADAAVDDPTIRRCRAFAKLWGCDGIIVANLYAYRSTDPSALWTCDDPVGPENDDHLYALGVCPGRIVCAWGANARDDRVREVVRVLQDVGAYLLCLGVTKSGAPRHPLYVASDQPLVAWTPNV
ncbi:DUF1643 domain-containing protein [Paraburkholderia domus]|uniref:DUF1643 domain-containing protein n=1 Tax=Paraburkholderia domus TaxID=2793075 RepID=UPI001911279C|nr:DUF1643 domain-containing protein [Paraburkholderia domus]MBK5061726.1 DUF1643 domain-containing protein [Burkholderia sp. R-70199]CAE6899338.1 hypothetical protein R70199_03599 [Paraburkholderia domus]